MTSNAKSVFNGSTKKKKNYLEFFPNVRHPRGAPPHFGENSQMISYSFITPLIEQMFGANIQVKSGMDTMHNVLFVQQDPPVSKMPLYMIQGDILCPCSIYRGIIMPLYHIQGHNFYPPVAYTKMGKDFKTTNSHPPTHSPSLLSTISKEKSSNSYFLLI